MGWQWKIRISNGRDNNAARENTESGSEQLTKCCPKEPTHVVES